MKEQGKIDILVNNVFTAPEGRSILGGGGFWEYPISLWDDLIHVGCRSHYVSSHCVVPHMIAANSGLIINISSFAGRGYAFNLAYGVGKCAVDRMSRDMAHELTDYDITCVALYPGWVATEHVQQRVKEGVTQFNLDNAESPRFTGRAVVALAKDEERKKRSGEVLVVYELAREYGFTDVDGRTPGDLGQQLGVSS